MQRSPHVIEEVMPMYWLLMFACAGSTQSTVTEGATPQDPAVVQTPAPAAKPEAKTWTTQELLELGHCRDDREIEQIKAQPLANGQTLLELRCRMAAYQGVYAYAWADSGQPLQNRAGEPLEVVGLPTLDQDTGTLTWTSMARGLGDCGDHYVYDIRDRVASLREHRARECGTPTEPVPDPSTWPLATPASKTSHCRTGETTFFECPTGRARVLSVCGTGETLQYRFGPVGEPELVFPANGDRTVFTHRVARYARSMGHVLTFQNGDVSYEVTELSGGGGPDGEANNFQGVYVSRDGAVIAEVACQAAPTADWDALAAAVGTTE